MNEIESPCISVCDVDREKGRCANCGRTRDQIVSWRRPLGETWAIGTEINLAKHLDCWHGDVNVVPLCGDACMDCDAMSQIDPNYLRWVLEKLAAGHEDNFVEVAPA